MRTFIINQLTMMSTWFGLLIILIAFTLPRDYIAIVGLMVLLIDDAHFQKFFTDMRVALSRWWKA